MRWLMFENECKGVHCSVDLSFEEEVELEATLQPCLCNMYLSLNSKPLTEGERV